jgi:hypothetical protein
MERREFLQVRDLFDGIGELLNHYCAGDDTIQFLEPVDRMPIDIGCEEMDMDQPQIAVTAVLGFGASDDDRANKAASAQTRTKGGVELGHIGLVKLSCGELAQIDRKDLGSDVVL